MVNKRVGDCNVEVTKIVVAFAISLTSTFCFAQQFSQAKKVTAPVREDEARFGSSVAVSKKYAIIGASEYPGPGWYGRGHAYIFEKDSINGWSFTQKLTASDSASGTKFGASVAIAGETAVVGAEYGFTYTSDGRRIATGAVYIYERNARGNWIEVQKITPPNPKGLISFGRVRISGDYIIVGAYNDGTNVNGTDSILVAGAAYFVERDQSGKWSVTQKVVQDDRKPLNGFGTTIGISGSTAVVGTGEYGNETGGKVYLFERGSDGIWRQTQKIPSPGGERGLFGLYVGIDGDRAVVGAPDDRKEGGAAYVFERTNGGPFVQVAKLLSPNALGQISEFGRIVSISGNYVLVGDDIINQAGEAYLFERGSSGEWTYRQNLIGHDTRYSDLFSNSVSISNNTALIGAVVDSKDASGVTTNGITDTGSAYFFEHPVVPSTEPCKDPKVSYNIPNVITPNGDGLNDQFKLPDELVGSRLIILNRWGSQVYSNDAYKNDWSGDDLTTGVYYYTYTLSKGCNDPSFRGPVTILR